MLHCVSVYYQLAFLLQSILKSHAERIEGCVLLGLEQLLPDLVGLQHHCCVIERLVGSHTINEPCSSDIFGIADLPYRHRERGFDQLAGTDVWN